MLTLLFFAFLSGVITIFAPCIWPLLPLLLSASGQEGKKRPLGVVTGIVTSFTIFTLFLSYLLNILPIDPDIFRKMAVVIIIVLGLTLLVPVLNRHLEGLVSRFTGLFGSVASKKREGFWGGYGNGFFLGILWSPCAGPILAAIATLAATRSVTIEAVLVTLAFAVGVGIPLFIIATLGQRVFTKSRKLSPYTARIQQVFGVIMILAAFAILFNLDKALQIKLLDLFPSYGSALNIIEDNEAVQEKIELLEENAENNEEAVQIKEDISKNKNMDVLGVAPEFKGISKWLNVDEALTQEGLKGKVVLIDFWTYSCINCIRTLPHVTGWYEKYKDDGFVVVGVHTPEFAFEHKTANEIEALGRYNITYPVAQDNDYATWKAYKNRYWPAHYLIDAEGNIRYTHFGEGKYDQTEQAIQELLQEAELLSRKQALMNKDVEGSNRGQTPESYLGYGRIDRFVSPESIVKDAVGTYSIPAQLKINSFAYGGAWTIEKERAVSSNSSKLVLSYKGDKVFLVLSPPKSGKGIVNVFLDGKLLETERSGVDVVNGKMMIDEERLYEIVDFGKLGSHELELQFDTLGTAVYAFTFG